MLRWEGRRQEGEPLPTLQYQSARVTLATLASIPQQASVRCHTKPFGNSKHTSERVAGTPDVTGEIA